MMHPDFPFHLWAIGLSRPRIAHHTGFTTYGVGNALRAKGLLSTQADAYLAEMKARRKSDPRDNRGLIRALQRTRKDRMRQADRQGLLAEFIAWERAGIAWLMALEIPDAPTTRG